VWVSVCRERAMGIVVDHRNCTCTSYDGSAASGAEVGHDRAKEHGEEGNGKIANEANSRKKKTSVRRQRLRDSGIRRSDK